MAAKSKTIIVKKAGILFSSAGPLRSGQQVKLPVAEADKYIRKGYAVKTIIRRKKRSAPENAEASDGGRDSDTGREPDNQAPQDAQEN